MADVQISDKQLKTFIDRMEKAGKSEKNPIAKQQKIVLNKVNSERVKNIRRAIKPFSYTGRLAKSVRKNSSYISKKDEAVKGRIYYRYQEYFGGEVRMVKTGKYNERGNLVHSTSLREGEYYAHVVEYGRRNGNYNGRHFLWDSESGVNPISEYQKALEKAVEDILLY